MRAEEYYGRAILASPGDGELLSLYGRLIWETQRDGDRARSYFDQAVHASPHDWYGTYYFFLFVLICWVCFYLYFIRKKLKNNSVNFSILLKMFIKLDTFILTHIFKTNVSKLKKKL